MPWLAIKLLGLPRWAWAIMAVVLILAGGLLWAHFHTQAAIKADRNAAKAEAVSTAREADERAEAAAEDTRDAIERSNADAKAAADGSDDPLAAALDRLRAQKNRDRQAAGRAD